MKPQYFLGINKKDEKMTNYNSYFYLDFKNVKKIHVVHKFHETFTV